MLAQRLKDKNMSAYRCAKLSGIPYTTLSELLRGKTKIEKCSADTLYRISKVLDVSMEELLLDSPEYRSDFETFKSNVCHMVRDKGDMDFIICILQNNDIQRYWDRQWYPESFYLLAMVDYLSRVNNIPLCTNYNSIRSGSLKEPIYPRDIELAERFTHKIDMKKQCRAEAIPEFLQFNIIESEVRNVY